MGRLQTLLKIDEKRMENMAIPPAKRGGFSTGQGLVFKDLSYTVTKKIQKEDGNISKEVDLLHEITGQALRGEVTAVMGPSGAGKSTFLDALAGRIASGSLGGSVSVDGRPVSASYMKMISAYVMQDDQLFPMLTVYETLLFAAYIRLPPYVTKQEKEKRVEDLLDQLGLKSAMHTYIGDEGKRGVSGGERRRVSIGVDIIHGPSLLFLDEPTSGLDSTSAFSVVEKVKDIAKSGSTVIMTIHQPSFRIQMLLDHLIILARGNLVYTGSPRLVEEYITGFGRQVPEGESSIEYLLDVIKEYEGSTVGLEPLVAYQREGTKPSEAEKTPLPKTSARAKTSLPKTSAHGKTSLPKTPAWKSASDLYRVDEDLEENLDHSLERKSTLHSIVHPSLASDFYKGFSSVLWRTPSRPPTWSTPARTPGRTPSVTSGSSAMWSATSLRTPGRTPVSAFHLKTPQRATPLRKASALGAPPGPPPVFTLDKEAQLEFASSTDVELYDEEEVAEAEYLYRGSKFANPWIREVSVLSWRNLLNVIRTPELFLSREIVLTVMALVLATLFKNLHSEKLIHDNGIKNVNHILSFYIFAVCLVFFSSNDAVPTFIQERFIFIRETSHNAYRASSYVVSSFLVYLPFFALQALTFALITYKLLLNLQGSFLYYWLILLASLVSTNAYVMLVSATVPSYITGYAVVIATTAIFFLNCGFFLKRTAIPKYWLWIHFISAIKYPFEALLVNQFKGEDCYNYGMPVPQPGPLGQIKYDRDMSAMNATNCGLNGNDVLFTMDIQEKSIWVDIAILLAWGVLYRFMFYLVLRFWSRNERK
ncbi:hypothetical protein KI387_031301 [Taxus chinensis]|uniref:ABC transporter domain-containing protein n=1 Tax=Taxus chinensis TaxID=29808 RepID=A0AA38FBC0_TAXCH|nr:hypothetical protein KI387_031301 [Taxus chinensis]